MVDKHRTTIDRSSLDPKTLILITLLADHAVPCDELIDWFRGRLRLNTVMRLRGDTEIHGAAAPLGCHVRRLGSQRLNCHRERDQRCVGQPVQSVRGASTAAPALTDPGAK